MLGVSGVSNDNRDLVAAAKDGDTILLTANVDKDIVIAGDLSVSQARFIQNEYAGSDYLIINELVIEDSFIDEFGEIICNKTEKVNVKNILNLKNCGKITLKV